MLAAASAGSGCGGDDLACGEGTRQKGDECIALAASGGAAGSGGDASVPNVPSFAGVKAVAPVTSTSVLATWSAASDAVTPAAQIVYDVFLATTSGAHDFTKPTLTSAPGANSAELTGLTAGSEVFVVVRARNAAGEHDSNTVEKSGKPADDTQAPTFAGAKAATGKGGGSVEVSWEAAKDDLSPEGALSYLVYWADAAKGQTFGAPAAISAPGATSVVVTGLPKPKTAYYFVVRARDAAGNLDTNSNEVSGKTGADSAAPVFGGCLLATPVSASSIDVSWNPAVDDSTPAALLAYNVYASKTPTGHDFTKPSGTFTGETHGVVTGLEANSTYYLVCRAKDASGNEDQNKSVRSAKTLQDSGPPTFGGGTVATKIEATSVELNWNAAQDDKSPQKAIVYDVHQADKTGAQDFTKPTLTSPPGATSIKVSGLKGRTQYFWVVRARDEAGNADSNTKEVSATTLVSFDGNVQPILTAHCAVLGCHTGANPTGFIVLAAGFSFAAIGNASSTQLPTMKLVEPGFPDKSYVYKKITGAGATGTVMPPPATSDFLTQAEKDTIFEWILQGGANN